MMSMRVSKESLDAFRKALRQKKAEAEHEGARAVEATVKLLESRVTEKVAKETTDTGRYLQSIESSCSGLSGDVIATAAHAVYVENGTRAHRPPFRPIYEWVWRKRLDFGIKPDEVGRVAKAIVDKIAREGTRPGHQWLRSIEETRPDFDAFLKDAIRRALL